MFALAAVPAIVLLLAVILLPESPRWLVIRGRLAEAKAVLSAVDTTTEPEQKITELQETARSESGSWRALFGPAVRPVLAIGVILALFRTVTGIDTVIYYAPTILHSAGLDAVSSILSTVGIGVVNVGMTVVSIYLLDRIGRRPPLVVGTAVMALGLAVLGLSFFGPLSDVIPSGLSIAMLMIFVGAFAVGLGPGFWLINAEIYPLRLRAKAAGLATMTIFGSNAIVSTTFLPMVEALGESGAFWVYGAITLLALAFIYRRVPETRGRTLEEIETALRRPADRASRTAGVESQ